MKILKWLLALAIVVAIVVTAVQLRRDSIGRDIANSILSEQGLVVTDLSVDALTPNRLELAELVIESDNGTRYEIYGLSTPVALSARSIDQASADRLLIVYPDDVSERSSLVQSLQTALGLPEEYPNLAVRIDSVTVGAFPELENVSWKNLGSWQSLVFDIDGIRVATSAGGQAGQQQLGIVGNDGTEDVLILSLDVQGAEMTGEAKVSLAAWLPTLQSLGLVPGGLESLDAVLAGPVTVTLDSGEIGHARVSGGLQLVEELAATFVSENDQATRVVAASDADTELDYKYPSRNWRVRNERVDTVISTADIEDLPVSLDKFVCVSGIRCTLDAHIDAQQLVSPRYVFCFSLSPFCRC